MSPSHIPLSAVVEARRLYRLRRMRDEAFGARLVGEPAWDLLLELYIAASEQRPVSAISASIAASVSTQEAIRWLSLLEELGLIERLYAQTDMNRAIVVFSGAALKEMTSLIQS